MCAGLWIVDRLESVNPEFVYGTSTSLASNPSLDRQLFELWFFAGLIHGFRLKARAWNQGYYDAMHMEYLVDDVGTKVRVRFVQVVTEAFFNDSFATSIRKLTTSLVDYQFEAVGVYFAVQTGS
ncbi:RNA helicase [Phytophthora palmivora]|uniref:RNA helicase n=1 Tax=Phytophthora palmivora TaxID=4796 RepID=A0A2P4YJY5_9STRA|nr:RNA helicase [Phytophthora palmivora]